MNKEATIEKKKNLGLRVTFILFRVSTVQIFRFYFYFYFVPSTPIFLQISR